MGLLGIDSNKASQKTNQASDNAKLLGNSLLAESGGLVIGSKAALNTGLQITGNKAPVNMGLDASGNTGTINIEGSADDLLANNANWLLALEDLNASSASAVESALKSVSGSTEGLINKVMDSIMGLAESKQTDGESVTKRYLVWIGAGLLVLGGIWLLKRRN